MSLKNPSLIRKSDDVLGLGLNLYKISSLQCDTVRLINVTQPVPKKELLSVKVNGIDDRWIYYDPVVAASIVFSGDPIPVHNTDYSYYMDALGRSYDSKKSFKELVEKEHLYCVHEIQHYLRKKYGSDNLRINENRIEQ